MRPLAAAAGVPFGLAYAVAGGLPIVPTIVVMMLILLLIAAALATRPSGR